MEVKLEQLKVFEQVARQLSFSRAAEVLYMSQSAVSQAVAGLEQTLGVRLFLRAGRSVSLTAEGQLLHEYAGNALALVEAAVDQLERVRSLEQGQLRIGAGDAITHHLLLPYLERFSRLHPGVRLQIVNRVSSQAVSLLKQGRLDLAFVNLPLADDAVALRRTLPVQDVFVAGARFSALRGRTLPLGELAAQPLILLEPLSNSRVQVEDFFLSCGVPLRPEIELGSHDLLLDLARAGFGVACVIRQFVQQALMAGEVFELATDPPLPTRSVGACALRGVSASPAAEAFLQLLGDEWLPA